MKKLAFLIISTMYSITCLGQQTVTLSDTITIELPNRAEKINKKQALSYAAKKFNYDKLKLNSITIRKHQNIYKIDNVLISLHTDNHSVKEGHLLAIKRGLDEMAKGDTTYTSILKKVNNNSVLIISSFINNIGRYDFFCFNTANTGSITGIFEFDKVDASEARVILDQLIKSIKFKE